MVLVVGIFRIPQSTLTFPLFDEWGWGPPPWPELGDLLPQSWLWFPTVSSELIDCPVWLLVSWTNTNTNLFMQMQKISNETFAKMASLKPNICFSLLLLEIKLFLFTWNLCVCVRCACIRVAMFLCVCQCVTINVSTCLCESVCACVCLCYSVFECFKLFYASLSFFLCVNAWEHCLLMGWVEGNKLRVLTTIYNDLNVLRVGHLLLHSGSPLLDNVVLLLTWKCLVQLCNM